MANILEGLAYSELNYAAFVDQHPHTTLAQRSAYFGSLAAEQMERRYYAEHCYHCDAELDEDEANKADLKYEDPICDECNAGMAKDECPDPRKGLADLLNRKLG